MVNLLAQLTHTHTHT